MTLPSAVRDSLSNSNEEDDQRGSKTDNGHTEEVPGSDAEATQEVFWTIDTAESLPAITGAHPTVAEDIDPSRYVSLQMEPEGSKRYATINELLRGDGFVSDPNDQYEFTLFDPGQKRLFIASAEAASPSVILAPTVEECLHLVDTGDLAQEVRTAEVAFDAGVEQLAQRALQGEDARERFGPLFDDIPSLISVCSDVDSSVRELLRQVDDRRAREMVERQYSQQIAGALSQHDIDADHLFEKLYDSDRPVLDDEGNIDLHVDIDRGMEAMSFRTPRGSLTIEEPELLWDCHCEAPGGSFTADQRPPTADDYDCPIHDHELGDLVTALFGEHTMSIHYEGIDVLWRESSDLWPPAVDAYHVFEGLRADGVFESEIASAIDVGSGTGFIGIGLASECPALSELYLSDWVLAPLAMSKLNFQRNRPYSGGDPELRLRLGLGFDYAHNPDITERDDPLDLCVCNPPYLPDLDEFDDIRINHTVAGTDLLENVITDGPSIADSVYVHFSDLALPAAREAAAEAGAELTLVGEKSTVPFRVTHALSRDNYTEALLAYGLEERSSGRYKYWHNIGTYRVET